MERKATVCIFKITNWRDRTQEDLDILQKGELKNGIKSLQIAAQKMPYRLIIRKQILIKRNGIASVSYVVIKMRRLIT